MSPDDAAPAPAWLLPWLLPWQGMQAASRLLDLAPEVLQQSINAGWTFGNLYVNSGNSSAPDTERAIVAQDSYGKQLGQTMDALAAVLGQLPLEERQPAIDAFTALRQRVEEKKDQMAARRAQRIVGDLVQLKQNNAPEFERVRQALLALLNP